MRSGFEWPITGLSDEGGLDCYKDTEVVGILVGNATVHDGVMFILRGMVTGKLTVEQGAIAYVHGIVVGNVTVNGVIAIYGMICGTLSETGSSVAYLSERSIVTA